MDLQGKRVAVLVEQQYQEMEVWYPVYRLREAGCKVTLVGPEADQTLSEQAGLPGQERQGGQGRQRRRFRRPRHSRRLRSRFPAPHRGGDPPGQRHGRAGQGRGRHLPRPVGAVLDAGAQGQERRPASSPSRTTSSTPAPRTSTRSGPRRQHHHQPQAGRSARRSCRPSCKRSRK